jgi:MFS family permease
VTRGGPLGGREFRLLFLGRVVSMLGNAIAPVALAFAVLDLTGSKSDLGFVLAARSVPQVLFLVFGGVVADRLPRHRVMVASSLVSGASQGGIALLLLTGNAALWHLVALVAVNGASSAFFFPASSGVIPQTVAPPQLQQANALLRLAVNATWIAGAAIGGVLVAATSPGWAILVDAATFALGAVFIGLMRLPAGLRMKGSTVLDELSEGWSEFRSRTWLWAIVLQFSIVNAVETGALSVLGPVVAKRDLGGAGAWGLILALQSAGLVTAGFLMLRLKPRRMLLVATLGVLLMGLPVIALAAPAPLAVVAGAAFVAGVGIETFGVLWDTTMQQEIPKEKLSRVYSYDALGSFVLIPIGLAAAGPVADAVGVQAALVGAVVLLLAATIPILGVRDVRELRRAS